jgi:hypothetical protein
MAGGPERGCAQSAVGRVVAGGAGRTLWAERARDRHLGRATRAEGITVTFADGQALDVDTVVWATGYRSDYSWIHLPVFGPDGPPRHQRGLTKSPGLYLLGMPNQYSRGSSGRCPAQSDRGPATGEPRLWSRHLR